METFKMSTKQICFILIAFAPLTKIINLPADAYLYAENSMWISLAINFAISIGMVWLILFINQKLGNVNFYQILTNTFGTVFAKIVFIIYAIYFIIVSYYPITVQKNFVDIALYETTPAIYTFLPFFLVSFYACVKGLKGLARSSSILMYFTIFGILSIILLSLGSVNFEELLPIQGKGLASILNCSFKTQSVFLDFNYFLFFMGNFKIEKFHKTKITLSYVGVALLMIFYYVVFIGVYGSIGARQFYSPIKMAKYNVALENIGRVDYLACFLLLSSSVYALALPLLICSYALQCVFNFKYKVVCPIIVNLIVVALLVAFQDVFTVVYTFIRNYLIYFLLFTSYVPLILFIFARRKKSEVY